MLKIVFLIDKLSLVVSVSAATLVLPLGLIMTYEALARFLLNLDILGVRAELYDYWSAFCPRHCASNPKLGTYPN